ncbi:unnamed protein product [Fusarium graminearum]|nr:unnamed protein product [Fusarium graminearum]
MPTLTILPPGMLKCLSSGTSLTRLIPYNRATRTSVMGGMNYHIDVRFDDGIIWIARIRRINATSPPPALRDYILRSEAATLLFLDKTAIPAPKVHDFALENPNPKQPYFYSGSNDLGDDEVIFARLLEEKGHRDLTRFVRNGRLQHRFSFCCGYDLADWDGFLGLFRGLRDAVGVDEGLEWDEWKTAALKRYQEDPGLQLLLARH